MFKVRMDYNHSIPSGSLPGPFKRDNKPFQDHSILWRVIMNASFLEEHAMSGSGIGLQAALGLIIVLLLEGGCGSDVAFRRFEVGMADPGAVFEAAEEVVKTFYTRYHGGLALNVDKKALSLETGYIYWKSDEDLVEDTPRVSTSFQQPRRQKLYLRVLPGSGEVDLEMLATYEVLSINDPDAIKSAEDIWKFVRQDNEVEDILYDEILKLLVEKGILDSAEIVP